jgi:hypothetical protein
VKERKMIELISPLGYPRREEQAERRPLETAFGKRMGFIWNQYQTTHNFWPRFERAFEALSKPLSVQRAYKSNTWTPLDKTQFSGLAGSVDYLIVGVGA